MKQEEARIALYSRKSKFTGKGESIANQIELCKEYVRTVLGSEAVARCVVFEDEGFSGKDLRRPAFQQMIEQMRQKKISMVVVYRVDRISRNLNDFSGLIEELLRMGVSFVSIREQFDTESPVGRAMMYMISVFSQLERETIAERIRDNMHELAKTGRWLGGNTPTGFTSESVASVTVDGKTRKACKLKLIPEEAELVQTIFDLYTQTDSLTAVEAELLHRHLKSKQGKDFTRFTIKGILQNPVYAAADEQAHRYFEEKGVFLFSGRESFDGQRGLMVYNRTDQEKGKATKYLPMTEWIVAVGEHPGLISGKQWIAVQKSLERNKSKSYRKPRSNEALLTGLLYCTCGERMYPKLTQRQTPEGDVVYNYVCRMKERSKRERCRSRNAGGNALDGAVLEQLKYLTEEADVFVLQLEKNRRFYSDSRDQQETQLTQLQEERKANEKTIDGLIDSLAMVAESIARPRVLKRIEELTLVNQQLEAQILDLEELRSDNDLSEESFDTLRQTLGMFCTSIPNMTVVEKRAAIRAVVRKAVWDGANLHLLLFGGEEDSTDFPTVPQILGDKEASKEMLNPPEKEEEEGTFMVRWCEDSK